MIQLRGGLEIVMRQPLIQAGPHRVHTTAQPPAALSIETLFAAEAGHFEHQLGLAFGRAFGKRPAKGERQIVALRVAHRLEQIGGHRRRGRQAGGKGDHLCD